MEDKVKQVIKIYDEIAEKYDEAFDANLDRPFLDKFLKFLKKGNKILDIGCGTGSLTNYFFKKGIIVEGIDLSTKMIEIAKGNYPKIPFRKIDIRKMNYRENSFDGVWAAYSLFHVNKKEFLKAVKKIRDILKSNGIFGLVMQEGEGETKMEDPFLPGEYIYFWLYSQKELRDILQKNGFRVLTYDSKEPEVEGELPYKKMLFIVKVIK